MLKSHSLENNLLLQRFYAEEAALVISHYLRASCRRNQNDDAMISESNVNSALLASFLPQGAIR